MSLEFLRLQKFYQRDGFVAHKRALVSQSMAVVPSEATDSAVDMTGTFGTDDSRGNLLSTQSTVYNAAMIVAKANDTEEYTPLYSKIGGRDVELYPSQKGLHSLELKTAVVRAEEDLQSVVDTFTPTIDALLARLDKTSHVADEALEEFIFGTRSNPVSGYGIDDLATDGKCAVTMGEARRILDLGVVPTTVVEAALNRLRFTNPTLEEISNAQEQIHKLYTMWESLPCQPDDASDRHDALVALAKDVIETIGLVAKFTNVDPLQYIREDMHHSDSAVEKLTLQIEDLMEKRKTSLARNRTDEVAEATTQLIKWLDQLLVVKQDRLDAIGLGGSDPNAYEEDLANWYNKVRDAVKTLLDAKKLLIDEIAESRSTTEKRARDEKEGHEAAVESARSESNNIMSKIRQNVSNEKHLLEDVRDKLKLVSAMSVERAQLVNDLMDHVSQEAIRVAEYENVSSLCMTYMRELDDLEAHANTCIRNAEMIQSTVDSVRDHVAALDPKGSLGKLLLEEQNSYLATFRQYGTEYGEHIPKLELRLGAVQKQRRAVKLQVETAMETLDPDVDKIRKEFSMIEESEAKAQATISKLQARMEVHSGTFALIEDDFEQKGIEFDNPLLELAESLVQRRKGGLEKTRTYVETEQIEADKINTAVRTQTANLTSARLDLLSPSRNRPTSAIATSGTTTSPIKMSASPPRPRTSSAEKKQRAKQLTL
eukprot:PhM_4_TR3634/c0_g1_i1/m.27731